MQSSYADLEESHVYIRDLVRETSQWLNFTSIQLPILHDHQLSGLSEGERILVPLCCSTLNGLASMTCQHHTTTTQLGNIPASVATMPTWPALKGTLAPINAAIPDLSHRVSAPRPKCQPPHPLMFPRSVSPSSPR